MSSTPARTSLVIAAKELIADGLVSLTLRDARGERLPDWTPGSHLDLVLADGATRQYSLCGDPRNPNEYRVAVRREVAGRGGSARIHDEVAVGDIVGFGGPRNHFALVPSPRLSFIAGGVGITPILPMIHQAEQLGVEWRLLYLGRSHTATGFLDELEQYGDRVTPHFGEESGRVDLAAWIGAERRDTKLYACGPVGMLDAIDSMCAAWRPGWVRMERFVAELVPPVRSEPFEVELARSGRTVTVEPGDSISTAVRAVGVSLLTSCGAGLCGTCETTVLAGTPDHRDSVLDEAERRGGQSMFPCVSSSLDARLVLDL